MLDVSTHEAQPEPVDGRAKEAGRFVRELAGPAAGLLQAADDVDDVVPFDDTSH